MSDETKIYYEKLVRDGIPEKLRRKGIAFEVLQMDDVSYRAELFRKVLEEASEIHGRLGKKELLKELCDLQAVLDALREHEGISDAAFASARAESLAKKGGFTDRTYLVWCDDRDYYAAQNTSPSIKPGRYRHYKGGEYDVVFVAEHSETRKPMVVYRSHTYDAYRVRPLEMFLEDVEVDGKMVPRFARIGDL